MVKITRERASDMIAEYSAGMPALEKELRAKLLGAGAALRIPDTGEEAEPVMRPIFSEDDGISEERIIAHARPVMRIRENKLTGEWVGEPESDIWKEAIENAHERLDAAIPSVGRIELTNSERSWVGTGWLIDNDIIVTNRHVAEEFARPDGNGSFVFRRGYASGKISSDIDFLEEENRADEDEHPIDRILLICDDYDVAFLRVRPATGKGRLPRPLELADNVEVDMIVGAVGYPARDPSINDQKLVWKVFGDVYEKKRFAPGRIKSVDEELLRHDCSTLGGNSGSVLIDFETGKAVGLHYGGFFDDSANVAVPASRLRTLLAIAKEIAVPPGKEEILHGEAAAQQEAPNILAGGNQTLRFSLSIPIEVVLQIGQPSLGGAPGVISSTSVVGSLEDAVIAARQMLAGRSDVLEVRSGYRFKNGWITEERVVVVVLRKKLSPEALSAAGITPLPRETMGFGIDVRTGSLGDQLRALDVDIATERPARPAAYREPKGFDKPGSRYSLEPVRARMDAIFNVSPDAGWPELKGFLGRVTDRLTATMYEWEVNHVSEAIQAAIAPDGRKLLMVTQKRGVGDGDATETAVEDMQRRLREKFAHVWASVRGPGRLFQSSYHIKVASRDREEIWLSSGNWKDSNQPEMNPAGDGTMSDTPLRKHNREWHAIVKNQRLAELFQAYIEFDYEQAIIHKPSVEESTSAEDIELFVPDIAFEAPRGRSGIHYFEPLRLTDEELEIQPLLTPDRDIKGQRMYMAAVTSAMNAAKKKIYIQNQSFKYSGDDNQEITRMLELLRQKQRDGVDVRIIFRDAKDFGRPGDLEDQQALIERLKDFGLKVTEDHLRVQAKCHTKGVIIDSEVVILGSQNFTNGGALFNRDASLLVRSRKVAGYFERIFLHDWENLAHNDTSPRIGGVRRARTNESTPPGYRRVKLSEIYSED
jgi:V8-like Glu-specific endopeptidase